MMQTEKKNLKLVFTIQTSNFFSKYYLNLFINFKDHLDISVHLPERKNLYANPSLYNLIINFKFYVRSIPIIKYFGEMSQERTLRKSVLSLSLQFIVCTLQFQFCAPVYQDHCFKVLSTFRKQKQKQKLCILMYSGAQSCPSKEPAASVNTVWKLRHPVQSWVCVGWQAGARAQEEPLQGKCASQPCGIHHAFTDHPHLSDSLVESSHGVVKLCYLPYNYCTKGGSKSYQNSKNITESSRKTTK